MVIYNDIPTTGSLNNGVWVYGSLVTDSIHKAHGENVYKDVPTQFELITYESVLERNL